MLEILGAVVTAGVSVAEVSSIEDSSFLGIAFPSFLPSFSCGGSSWGRTSSCFSCTDFKNEPIMQ